MYFADLQDDMDNQEMADGNLFDAHTGIAYFNILTLSFLFFLYVSHLQGLLILHVSTCVLIIMLYHFLQTILDNIFLNIIHLYSFHFLFNIFYFLSCISLIVYHLITVEQSVSVPYADIENQQVINVIDRDEMSSRHRLSRHNLEDFADGTATGEFYLSNYKLL